MNALCNDKAAVRRAVVTSMATLAAVAVGLTGIALAANPKPGATYAGRVPEHLIQGGSSLAAGRHLIKFTVSDDGNQVAVYRAHFATNGCQFGADNVTKDTDIPINDGSFADRGSYPVGDFIDHVKIAGDFVKHGRAADVTFHWTSSQPDCPDAIKMKGRVHVQ